MKCKLCKTEMVVKELSPGGKLVWWCMSCGWMEARDKTWEGFHPPPGWQSLKDRILKEISNW